MDEIKYILLDLDGTLLDKNFDDVFWLEFVPERYSRVHSVSVEAAREHLFDIYRKHEETLKWTDLDFWSESLELDIPAMKRELSHLIGTLPHAEEFLIQMRQQGKSVHLLTNAHHKSVSIKFEMTGIAEHFDSVQTSNEVGCPKEHQCYWQRTQKLVGFDPAHSLFIDDTEAVLYSAREFGIKWVVHKARASSKIEPVGSTEFQHITDFNELMTPG